MRLGFFRTCGLGDAAQLTPLLRQAREDYPEAEIVLYVNQGVAPLFVNCPYVNETIGLAHDLFKPYPILRRSLYWRAWQAIRRGGPWDIFVTLEPRWYRNFNFWWVRAKNKVGQVTTGTPGKFLFDHWTEKNRGGRAGQRIHQCERYLELWTEATQKPDRGYSYDLAYLPEQNISLPEQFLCLAPGSGNFLTTQHTKKWIPAYWADLAQRIEAESDWQVVWLGTQGDLDPALSTPAGLNLMGKTNLLETVTAIRRSAGLIGNDSGLFHIALGLRTPAAAFFGPTESGFTGSFRNERSLILEDNQLPCRPCYQETCTYDGVLPRTPLDKPYCQALVTPPLAWQRLKEFFQQTNDL